MFADLTKKLSTKLSSLVELAKLPDISNDRNHGMTRVVPLRGSLLSWIDRGNRLPNYRGAPVLKLKRFRRKIAMSFGSCFSPFGLIDWQRCISHIVGRFAEILRKCRTCFERTFVENSLPSHQGSRWSQSSRWPCFQ